MLTPGIFRFQEKVFSFRNLGVVNIILIFSLSNLRVLELELFLSHAKQTPKI